MVTILLEHVLLATIAAQTVPTLGMRVPARVAKLDCRELWSMELAYVDLGIMMMGIHRVVGHVRLLMQIA